RHRAHTPAFRSGSFSKKEIVMHIVGKIGTVNKVALPAELKAIVDPVIPDKRLAILGVQGVEAKLEGTALVGKGYVAPHVSLSHFGFVRNLCSCSMVAALQQG